MKKITRLLLCTLVFVVLFYHQEPGINFSLFAVFLWGLLFFSTPKKRRRRPFWALSIALFLSAFSLSWYGDDFSFFALYFSVIALGIQAQFPKLKPVLYPLLLGWNYLSFIFRIFFFNHWLPKMTPGNKFWKRFIALFLIPALFGLAFIGIYAAGSDLFARFFQQFYIDFDVFSLLFVAALGGFLMFSYWLMWVPREAIRLNQNMSNDFSAEKINTTAGTFSFLDIDFERKSGEISLIVVNLILLFFIVTYNYEQFFSHAAGGSLSQEIHERVATIIFSIVMAIALLMFYFKSTFNFDPKAKFLKQLAYIWMTLNTVLILSAFLKNGEYILHFGLTFKRISVFIFLLLSLTGLVFSYLKIKHRRTNACLVNNMIRVFFGTFVVCSLINFSWMVTAYNIRFHKDQDSQYLQQMPYNYRLLYQTYRQDPEWQPYFEQQATRIQNEKARSFLSARLYYWF